MRMKYFSKFNIVTFLLHSIHKYQFFFNDDRPSPPKFDEKQHDINQYMTDTQTHQINKKKIILIFSYPNNFQSLRCSCNTILYCS